MARGTGLAAASINDPPWASLCMKLGHLSAAVANGILITMTDLILVRHAQTVANVAGRWEGWTDGELTPLGREQAEATAQRLTAHSAEVAALHTSPLLRALETARVIGAALGLPPVVANDLKEINFGQLDGVSPEEMERHHPALHARWRNRDDLGFTWPGGEQRAAFLRRVASACDRILSLHPRETALIVSHGGTTRVLLAHLLPSKQRVVELLSRQLQHYLHQCGGG